MTLVSNKDIYCEICHHVQSFNLESMFGICNNFLIVIMQNKFFLLLNKNVFLSKKQR